MLKEKYFGLSRRIARWMLDTPLENWLVSKVGHNVFFCSLRFILYLILLVSH